MLPSSFSLQTEGTRLQKDLRTYLASVKGKGQVGLLGRWASWDTEGPLPSDADGCSTGKGSRVCGGGVRAGSRDPHTSWAFGGLGKGDPRPWLQHGPSAPQPCTRPPRN